MLLGNATDESVSGTLDLDSDKVHSALFCMTRSAMVSSEHMQGMNLSFAW